MWLSRLPPHQETPRVPEGPSEVVSTQHTKLLLKNCLKILYLRVIPRRGKNEDFMICLPLNSHFPLSKVHPRVASSILLVCLVWSLGGLQEATLPRGILCMSERGRLTQSLWSGAEGGRRWKRQYNVCARCSCYTYQNERGRRGLLIYFSQPNCVPPLPQSFSSQKMAPLSSLPNFSQGNHQLWHRPHRNGQLTGPLTPILTSFLFFTPWVGTFYR